MSATFRLALAVAGGTLFLACDSSRLAAPVGEVDAPAAEAEAPAFTPSPEQTRSEPHFTPMTLRPVLANGSVVMEVLNASYPPLLRDAGIGGSTVVWIHIATSGEVDDARVFEIIRNLKPSARGELEITDVNNAYIEAGTMTFEILEGWWTDAGTFESLHRASTLVHDGGANLT